MVFLCSLVRRSSLSSLLPWLSTSGFRARTRLRKLWGGCQYDSPAGRLQLWVKLLTLLLQAYQVSLDRGVISTSLAVEREEGDVPLLVLGPRVHLRATLSRGEGGLVPRLQPACVSVWGRDFLRLRLQPRPNACCKSGTPWPARSRARRSSHRCSPSCLYRCHPGSRRTAWDHAAFVAQRRCTISSAFLNDSVILPSVDKLARIVSIGVLWKVFPALGEYRSARPAELQ
jgi:hypothetical protein